MLLFAQVAANALEPALDRVHVTIDEAGSQQAAGNIDDPRIPRCIDITHSDDAVVLDDDARQRTQVSLAVEDVSVPEDGRHGAQR